MVLVYQKYYTGSTVHVQCTCSHTCIHNRQLSTCVYSIYNPQLQSCLVHIIINNACSTVHVHVVIYIYIMDNYVYSLRVYNLQLQSCLLHIIIIQCKSYSAKIQPHREHVRMKTVKKIHNPSKRAKKHSSPFNVTDIINTFFEMLGHKNHNLHKRNGSLTATWQH